MPKPPYMDRQDMPKKAKKRANRSKKQSGNASKAKRDEKLSQKKQDQHVQGDEASAAGPAGKTARGEIRPECPLSTSRWSASAGCTTESISVAGAASAPTKLVSHTKDPGWELPTRGLANLGNTCFLNSVLQNMFKTRLLHQALLGDASGREDDAFVGPVTKALRKTILEIKGKGSTGSNRGAYSPKALLAAIQCAHPLFRGSHQQDAHELFMYLVGSLEDEYRASHSDAGLSSDGGATTDADDDVDDVDDSAFVESPMGGDLEHARAPPRSLHGTAVTDVFGGVMCSAVTCSTCAARSFSTEATMCLSVHVPKKKFVSRQECELKKAAVAETAKIPSKPVAAHLGGARLSAKERREISRQEHELKKAPAAETAKIPSKPVAAHLGGARLSAKERRKISRQDRKFRKLQKANGAQSPSPPPGDQATAQCGDDNLHDREGGMDPKGALRRKGSDSSDAVLTDSETEQCTTSKDEGSKSAADVFDVASTTFDTFACVKNPLNRLVEPPARATKAQGHDSLAVSVYDCLDHFMAEEALLVADGNGLNCEACCTRRVSSPSVKDGGGGEEPRQDARKRLLMLGSPPGVLVCHLKRLQTTRKTCQRVEFDLDLDMSPYFWQDSQAPLSPEETRYRLFGLVEHRGSCLGGHYAAYVQDKGGWKYASDATVRPATLHEVKNCEAYMLFYERCDTPSCPIG